ncbi:hypothetical protein BC937DRAFT_94673 [Endogone sp. FLAS-F59071]|nr:hypothetical protein BC937DRAFT_94673 [Endogone sp. FLAS-F59071]|eukprot:RUS22956.1 hypothetical protein BC937DRAFT_94673 [Endogone sp. FLAS-F59071]
MYTFKQFHHISGNIGDETAHRGNYPPPHVERFTVLNHSQAPYRDAEFRMMMRLSPGNEEPRRASQMLATPKQLYEFCDQPIRVNK